MSARWALHEEVLVSCLLLLLTAGCGDDKGTGPEGVQSRIAFVSNRDGNDEIYVIDPDGTNLTRLTNNWGGDVDPAWSPDGTKIAFLSGRVSQSGIYVMQADGTNPTLLFALSGGYFPRLAWEPGTRIAFPFAPPQPDPRQSGNSAIYVIRADGTETTRLTDPAGDGEPAWSPDGTRIALISNDRGAGIFVMAADGNNMTRLTTNGRNPAWSPDGTKIAFTGWGGEYGKADLVVMNADGGSPVNLTNDPADDRAPTWSPDGTQIAFSSDRNHIPEVYVMNADGTNQTQVTWNPSYGFVSDAHDLSPAWSPFLKR